MVSYQTADADAAELLHVELALRGMVVAHDQCTFTDGGRIDHHMTTAVNDCDAFVIYLTPNSLYLGAAPGTARPALDSEFLPVMARRRTQLAKHPTDSASTLRPVVVPLTHGLGDPRGEAPAAVRRATGEDIASLWSPVLDQTTTAITQPEAARVAAEVLRSLLPPGTGVDEEPIEIAVMTRGAGQPSSGVTIDATPLLGGASARPGNPSEWNRYLGALLDVEAVLAVHGQARTLRVRASTHLTGAIAFGRVFNQAGRWRHEVQGRHGWAEHCDATFHPDLQEGWDPGNPGSRDLSVEIDLIGQPVTAMANAILADLPDAVRGRLQLVRQPDSDLSSQDLAEMANAAAASIRRRVGECRPDHTHIMCAAPVEFGVLLGYRLTSLHTELRLYERSGPRYQPSLTVPADWG
jgi:hypothetical protein